MFAGLGLVPFGSSGSPDLVLSPVAAWFLLLAAVALGCAFLWWTGRCVVETPAPERLRLVRRRV